MTVKKRKIYKELFSILKKTYNIPFDKPTTSMQEKLISDMTNFIAENYKSKKNEEIEEKDLP